MDHAGRGPTDLDYQIAMVAARQHGAFSRSQAYAAGASRAQVRTRIAKKIWRPASDHVLTLTSSPDTFEQRVWCSVLQMRAPIVSHRAAARLHGFRYLGAVEPEVTITYPDEHKNPFGRVHRSADLRPEDITGVGALQLTSPARTAADLFVVLSEKRAVWIADEALAAKRFTLDELAHVHARYARRGRPGTRRVRTYLRGRGTGWVAPMSLLESRAIGLFERGDLHPERQVPLPGWLDRPGAVDFAFVADRVIVEVDGRRWHSRDQDFENDRERDNAAQVAGWTVLRFTWDQVVNRPGYVLATVRAALRQAARLPLAATAASPNVGK